MTSPRVGDEGTPFTLTVYSRDGTALDISSASPLDIYLYKPDGSKLEKEGLFVTDGTDGKMKYTIESGVFDTAGQWSIQGRVTFINAVWNTDICGFLVEAKDLNE